MYYRVFRYFVISSIIAIFISIILMAYFLFQTDTKTAANFDKGDIQSILHQIAINQTSLIQQSHQVNQVLNIPNIEYQKINLNTKAHLPKKEKRSQIPELQTESTIEKKEDALELNFYNALHQLNRNLKKEKSWQQLIFFLNSSAWSTLLKANQLVLRKSEEAAFIYPKRIKGSPRGQANPPWFSIKILSKIGGSAQQSTQMQVRNCIDNTSLTTAIELSDRITQYIQNNAAKLYKMAAQYNAMYSFITSSKLQKALKNKDLQLTSLEKAKVVKVVNHKKRTIYNSQVQWVIKTKDQQDLAQFHFNIAKYQLRWDSQVYLSLDKLKSEWQRFYKTVDHRTTAQKKEQEMRTYLHSIFHDKAFKLQMQQYGFSNSQGPPREDLYYEYYEILNKKGEKIASFALQKRIGVVYLMDKDDVPILSLQANNNPPLGLLKKKKIQNFHPTLTNPNKQHAADSTMQLSANRVLPSRHSMDTILLIGTHDTMADVLMIGLIDTSSKDIFFISIPRDLYFMGTKINSVYSQYGIQTLMSYLSQIIGIPLTKYISIDMYAFIELVNIIGGVDVYLKEDLIDPSYKIKQMGQWETLIMYRGQHSLQGLGALRYARSRQTSNDFERSKRQQQILQQIIKKLKIQITNPKKMHSFWELVRKYFTTNLHLTEIIMYWYNYRDYSLHFGNSMNTNNILYHTYTNYLDLNPQEFLIAQKKSDFYRGSFILLPKNNDWNLIHQYLLNLKKQ